MCEAFKMMRRTPRLDEFYRELNRKEDLSHEEALRIYEALHEEAVALGAISHENIWDGFEIDLRIAKAMQELERIRKAGKANCRKTQ
jgi:hypothetical protein